MFCYIHFDLKNRRLHANQVFVLPHMLVEVSWCTLVGARSRHLLWRPHHIQSVCIYVSFVPPAWPSLLSAGSLGLECHGAADRYLWRAALVSDMAPETARATSWKHAESFAACVMSRHLPRFSIPIDPHKLKRWKASRIKSHPRGPPVWPPGKHIKYFLIQTPYFLGGFTICLISIYGRSSRQCWTMGWAGLRGTAPLTVADFPL